MYVCVHMCAWWVQVYNLYVYILGLLFHFACLPICSGTFSDLFFYFTLNLGWVILNNDNVISKTHAYY